MIIFGFSVFYIFGLIGRGQFHCPNCGGDRNYEHRTARRFFTLFFLPVIPLDKVGEVVDKARVAGIPMRSADQIIGALNLYSPEPREWSDEDMAVARVLADIATSYVVHAAKLRRQEHLIEQLQEALEARIVIEQAKGITFEQN